MFQRQISRSVEWSIILLAFIECAVCGILSGAGRKPIFYSYLVVIGVFVEMRANLWQPSLNSTIYGPQIRREMLSPGQAPLYPRLNWGRAGSGISRSSYRHRNPRMVTGRGRGKWHQTSPVEDPILFHIGSVHLCDGIFILLILLFHGNCVFNQGRIFLNKYGNSKLEDGGDIGLPQYWWAGCHYSFSLHHTLANKNRTN